MRFYRETPDKVAYRIEEGCSVVEMECASLAAVAQLRGAIWGMLLFTADSLADLEIMTNVTGAQKLLRRP